MVVVHNRNLFESDPIRQVHKEVPSPRGDLLSAPSQELHPAEFVLTKSPREGQPRMEVPDPWIHLTGVPAQEILPFLRNLSRAFPAGAGTRTC